MLKTNSDCRLKTLYRTNLICFNFKNLYFKIHFIDKNGNAQKKRKKTQECAGKRKNVCDLYFGYILTRATCTF